MSLPSYGNLCSIFYDATKGLAPQREVDFYAAFIKDPQARILEAMCGSGRLMIPFMQRGYQVDGIDNAKSMLANCRQRCAQLGLSPVLYEQSLEQMAIPLRYDLVTIAVASFQLITDKSVALHCLKNIRAHMNEGASILIDTYIPDVTNDPWIVRTARLDEHRVIRLTMRHIYDVAKKLADAYCLYELLVDGTVQSSEKELIRITWYNDKEIELMLRRAGFKFEKIYEETLRSSGPSRIVHAVAM